MRHRWDRRELPWRHVAALPLGGALSVAVALAFARMQPWERGLSFIGSLYLFIALWLAVFLSSYLVRRPRALVAGYAVVTLAAALVVRAS